MQSTEVKDDVQLVKGNRAGKGRVRLNLLFVFFAMNVCIPFKLPSAVGLEGETSSLMPTHGCEEVVIPLCKGVHPNNQAKFPNSLGHHSQADAGLEVHQFFPLVKINCSDSLAYFVCIVYAPPCFDDLDTARPPCRSLCLAAKNGCAQVMNRFGFEWPENLDCLKFPLSGRCIGEDRSLETSTAPPSPVHEQTDPTEEIPTRFLVSHGANDYKITLPQHAGCQAITVPLCRGLQYNETMTPNLLGHGFQDQAERELNQFAPWVRINCSPYLRYFLCATFVPPCNSALISPLPPCRALCLESQRGCQAFVDQVGSQWPDFLDCSKFPVYGLCVGKEAFLDLQILAVDDCESRVVKDEGGLSMFNLPYLYSTPSKIFVAILSQIILTGLW